MSSKIKNKSKKNKMKNKIKSELDLIASIARKPKHKDALVGIGDDCAVIEKNKSNVWLVGLDTLTEGDHFSMDYFFPEDVGWKAMESNLSDIAAMGGTPKFAFLSLVLRKGMDMKFVEGFYKGIYKSAGKHGIDVLGGDTTHGKTGMVSITLIGGCRKKNLCLRSDAKLGDYILVSGKLGGSTAGLRLFLKGKHKNKNNEKKFAKVLKKHLHPKSRTDIAEKISGFANAMEDVSDGLASEVRNICYASKAGGIIYSDKIPIAKETEEAAAFLKENARDYALFGGEDFELVFTCKERDLKKAEKFGKVVGRIIKGRKIYLEENGRKRELKKFGYDHFA